MSRNQRTFPASVIALTILSLALGAAFVFGQGGSGRAPQNGSGRGNTSKTKPANVKPGPRVISYPRVAAPTSTPTDAVQLRVAELCARRSDQLSEAEREWQADKRSVTVAPSNDPVCRELPLVTKSTCKEWIRIIDAPSDAPCPRTDGLGINENDNLLTQMIFRDALKQGRRLTLQWETLPNGGMRKVLK